MGPDFHDVSINTQFPITTIEVDGKRIHGVRSIRFYTDIDSVPTVEIEALASNIKIDGKVIVKGNKNGSK
ncbi:hypothetical protein [Caproiciproducens galactitolivorans]|uniref:Lipid/polyisoprenoid-binding YceI-like domain-containing protein n=1 Tax=Caproiciproducens galactitolivorans TaxID=642589 RepID=A0ABT4BWF4_9FIRM|nr:hypothetical protein [Caproiciproducens galactitolivorans]MCY1715222.1 hypothetical protein [Caproiciproducens galactitolivorans]